MIGDWLVRLVGDRLVIGDENSPQVYCRIANPTYIVRRTRPAAE